MGKGTRIRWQNVAKLGAGVVICIALLAGLPALLERPKPPPLPADIGLMHVADDAPAASLSATRAAPHRQRSAPHHERPEDTGSRHERHPEGERRPRPAESSTPRPDRHEAPTASQPTPVAAPAPSPPASTPAPAPAYSPPPPAPAPTPVTASSSPAPTDSGGEGEEAGGSEFGFEH